MVVSHVRGELFIYFPRRKNLQRDAGLYSDEDVKGCDTMLRNSGFLEEE